MNYLKRLSKEAKTLKEQYFEIENDNGITPEEYIRRITPIESKLYDKIDEIEMEINKILKIVDIEVRLTPF